MEKKMYTLRLEVGNRVEFDTLKTVWKMETVVRKAREELEPRFPKAKLVITCGDTMVTVKWEPERKPVIMGTDGKPVEEKAVPMVYVVRYTYMYEGRYVDVRREFADKSKIQRYRNYLHRSGAEDVAYEILCHVRADWRKQKCI